MLRFPRVKLYRQAFTETICMQLEYARMKCLSKAFCIHLVSLCVSALNHCTLNRLLKMFVLLPTATINRYKMTFIFLMCTYTHTMRTSQYHLFILSNDRIESDNAVANNSSLFNEMKFGDRKQPGTRGSKGQHHSAAVICHR